MEYTALVRSKKSGAYSIRRTFDCHNMKEFADELRGNGYKVAKNFVGFVNDIEVDEWHLLNRK